MIMKKAGIYRAPYQPKVRPWVNYTHYNDYTEYNIAVVKLWVLTLLSRLLCVQYVNIQYVIIIIGSLK